MKFWMFHLMPWPYLPNDFEEKYDTAWVTCPNGLFDPARGPEVYHRYINQLAYADELGFDGVVINEHHQNAYGIMPSPNLIAAALSQRMQKARVMVLGNGLPLYEVPLKIAEEFAMLDNMFRGRFDAGFVVGGGPEYYSYNINPTFARERFREATDLIVKAWTDPGPFSWDGKHFQFQYVNPWPRPVQKPHPPIWIPGVGSVETMELVAERGFIYAALTYAHVDSFRQNATFFQQTVARVGRSYNPEMLGWLVPMYVAETDRKAREEAEEHVWYFIDKLIKGFAGKGRTWMPPGYTSLKSLQRLQEINSLGGGNAATNWQLGHARNWDDVEAGGSVLIGSPQTVREQLLKYVLEFKVGHILSLPQFGSLPDHLTRKNMELLAAEVFPYVRKYAEAEFGSLPGVQARQTDVHA
ncbi:MAG TPA: LLM class flavin-dependent oxidoreductase [Candidatus Binatia bacterium]|nr:LLM class flavin-dependent oxidoreductase [Candidatus Binatia bacterium]